MATAQMKRKGPMGRDGKEYIPQSISQSTADTLGALTDLNSALEAARAKYRGYFLSKRPSGGFTIQEFTDNYNTASEKNGLPAISKRAAEAMFKKWVDAGDYQRAPMMLAGIDGISRRTYVYWQTK